VISIHTTPQRLRVVIIGAGFGGLSAAKQLAQAPFDVTVIDCHNYHLFQPLLYQAATAALSPGDIASPIRGILHRQKNANVILATIVNRARNMRDVAHSDKVDWERAALTGPLLRPPSAPWSP
jgi:NADH:ubiquinone reductase (H+-translocating)